MTFKETLSYLFKPLQKPEFWLFMGKNDIRYKYKRTLLGPFWVMLTNAVYVAMLAFVFGALFKSNDPLYVPWVASGVILWNSVGAILRESSTVFYEKKGFLLQSGDFMASELIYWVIWRNIIVFLHQLPIIVAVLLIFKAVPDPLNALWLIPGTALFLFTLMPVALILALLTARLRDLEPLIGTGLMALFFVTPIMWHPEMLGDKIWMAAYNPMTYLLELIRDPLIGLPVQPLSYIVSGGVAIYAWALAIYLYKRFVNRLSFWV